MATSFEKGWRPAVIGEIVAAHSAYYAREWGFGAFFEAKVAQEIAAFIERYDPSLDLLLSAWDGDGFLGSGVIDASDPALESGEAHLRWFIAVDRTRGSGIGGRLLADALAFLDGTRRSRCFLTTF